MSSSDRSSQAHRVSQFANVLGWLSFVLFVVAFVLWVKYPEWKTARLVGKEFRAEDFTIFDEFTPPEPETFDVYHKEYAVNFPHPEQIARLIITDFEYVELVPVARIVILGIDSNNRIVHAQIGIP